VGVTASTLTLTVTADTGSVITVNGVSPVSDQVTITLGAVGSVTVATVLIIAPDGTTTKVYTVSIYRTSV
jgi:hypothetical protein